MAIKLGTPIMRCGRGARKPGHYNNRDRATMALYDMFLSQRFVTYAHVREMLKRLTGHTYHDKTVQRVVASVCELLPIVKEEGAIDTVGRGLKGNRLSPAFYLSREYRREKLEEIRRAGV